jgi:hypothetical protein
MIDVDRNVPIPEIPKRNFYPWSDLKVGDSFLVADKGPVEMSARGCQRAKTHPGEKYYSRRVYGGTRVWRVA